MIKKGNAALQNSNYTSAENYFNRAIIKDKSKAEAYTGLANIYVARMIWTVQRASISTHWRHNRQM